MKILAIETSCDETGAAVIVGNPGDLSVTILSNVLTSSLSLHAKTGGIIPEIAARKQVEFILPVIEQALRKADVRLTTNNQMPDIDAIAVTYGPGLIGSLLVGIETAKTLSYIWNKPLIPVNHLYGHIYANFIDVIASDSELVEESRGNLPKNIPFPAIALIVSGGHTDLVVMKSHKDIQWLGGTRDDAAGEAMDKIGRLLGFPYPAGPTIEKHAKLGNEKAYNFPKALIQKDNFDFSFSGLKTAALRETQKLNATDLHLSTNDISASVQKAIIDVLVKKTISAARKYNTTSILLGGGVAANQHLKNELILNTKYQIPNTEIFVPQKFLCTDNAAMIGAAAFFTAKAIPWKEVDANPELYFD